MTRLLAALAALTLLPNAGCVAKKKYTALQDRHGELQDAYANASIGYAAEKGVLQARIDALRERNHELAAFYQDIVDAFGDDMAAGDVTLMVYPDRVALQLAHDVTFDSGSATLSDEGTERMDKIARLLKKHRDRNFQVEGHTDTQTLTANAAYDNNWELGAARSLTVVEALVGAGVDDDQLSAATYGDTEPVASNATEDGRKSNRRVEIALRPSLDEIPGHNAIMWHAQRLDADEQAQIDTPTDTRTAQLDRADEETH